MGAVLRFEPKQWRRKGVFCEAELGLGGGCFALRTHHRRWVCFFRKSEEIERALVGLGFEVFGEGSFEDVGAGGDGEREKRHGGAEFEGVDWAENLFSGAILNLVYYFGAFEKARAEDGMGEMGLGFF